MKTKTNSLNREITKEKFEKALSNNGGIIHLKMFDSGMFREIATQYGNIYQDAI